MKNIYKNLTLNSTDSSIISNGLSIVTNPVSLLILLLNSNIIAMLTMNTFVLRTRWIVFVYLMSIVITLIIQIQLGPFPKKSAKWSLSSRGKYLMFAVFLFFLFVYTFPRVSYLAEAYHGYAITTFGDDSHHIQELNSMINTPRYPPVSSFQGDKYFSFYYAPWMLMAFLYHAIPFSLMTIKVAYSIGYAIYVCLILLALFQIAALICQNRRHYYLFLSIILLYSGIESIFIFMDPLKHNEWWMLRFGIKIQISSFSTLNLWVMHHLLGGVALVLAFITYHTFRKYTDSKLRFCVIFICALLLATSFYSSVFAFIGGIPFLLFLIIKDRMRFQWLLPSCILGAVLITPVLWMYLRKDTGFVLLPHIHRVAQKFQFLSISSDFVRLLFSFMIFLILVSGELLIYLVAVIMNIRDLWKNHTDTILVMLCFGCSVLLFFLGYSGSNNLAMRGMIVPIFVLAYISSKYLQKQFSSLWLIALLLILSLGSFNELLWFNRRSLLRMIKKTDDINVRKVIYTQYNTVRVPKSINADEMNIHREDVQKHLYIIEKIVVNHEKPIARAEIEIMSDGPFGLWKYQDWLTVCPSAK